MKFARIVETDPGYVQNFMSFLIQCGAGPTADPLCFEVEDDFPENDYHGLEFSQTPARVTWEDRHPEEAAWLRAYRGSFDFYLSLKRQLVQRGSLSEKQIECIRRAIARDQGAQQRDTDRAVYASKGPIKPGMVLILSQFAAEKVCQSVGYARARHRAVEVVEVHGETQKAYRLTVKLSAKRTTYCGICGRFLENPESVAAGIGPICAERVGVGFSGESLDELREALTVVRESAPIWIAKRSIKNLAELTGEKVPELEEAV